MQIPGAAENAHLYQRQRLTGRLLTPLHLAAQMLHSILNLLGNLLLPVLKCSFSSASASSGSSAVSALSTPKVSLPFQKNFSVSATSAVCADKERQCHFGSIFPRIPAEQKKKPDFLTRLTHRVLRPSKSDFSFTSLAPFKCPEIANHLRSCAADRRNPGSH